MTRRDERVPPVSDRARLLIIDRYRTLLQRARSPLLANPAVVAQMVDQMNSVLDAVPHVDLDAPVGVVRAPDESESVRLSVNIGVSRASAGVHPTESLRAATYIFEAAFPVLCGELARQGVAEPETTAGLRLNRAIMDRIAVASTAYVDYLLQKVHNSHLEERRRMGRELHDRAAPAVIVGLQSLDMHDVYRPDSPARAEAKLTDAREALAEALQVIRHLAAESRDAVGPHGLEKALERYLLTAPPDVDASLALTGDPASIPGAYAQELFLVLREATRNALVHARPSTLLITLDVGESALYGCVRDDGVGFDVDLARERRPGIGLMSMRERVALLGGTFTLASRPRAGTTVEVLVPLPGALR